MKLYIARCKEDDTQVMSTEWPTFDCLDDKGMPQCNGTWTREKQDGTLPEVSRRFSYSYPEEVYKHIRRALKEKMKSCSYSWAGTNSKKMLGELKDKKFQKDYFQKYGENILIETYQVNLRTGRVEKTDTQPLSEFYPKRISEVYP